MDNKNETFNYTYSAAQQKEIRSIREKYIPKKQSEDKLEQLHTLDKAVTRTGTIISIIIGILSTLILGTGMCCTMIWPDTMFIPGIFIGILGIIGIIVAYPVYSAITKKHREKLAPEIIRLTDELMS